MAQNKSNKIEYWKIGTSFLNYYKVILYWLQDENFLNLKTESNYQIIIEKVIDSNNLKNKTNRFEAFFEGNKEIKLYVKESKNNDNKKDIDNIYNEGTLYQFIDFLKFFDIYENNGSDLNLNINKNFINNVITKVSKDKLNVKKILSNYINEVLISKIEKKINWIKTFDSDIQKDIDELTKKDDLILNSITIDIAKYLLKKKDQDSNFDYYGITKKAISIKNNNNIETDAEAKYFFSLIEEIKEHILNEEFNNLICKIKEYIEILSSKNNWYLGCVPILEFKTKENDSLEIVKIFEDEDEDEESEESNKTQNQNLEESEIGNSFLTNMYTLLIERTNANNKLFLPIFQRDYVWNESIVSNFLLSLFDDIQNKKKSYLNNIIFFDNIINKSSSG